MTSVTNKVTNVTISDAIKYFHANPALADSLTTGTDAVNLDLLNATTSSATSGMDECTDQNASQVIDTPDKSIPMVMGTASALQSVTQYLLGRTTLNAGVAAYGGHRALALGASRWEQTAAVNYNPGVSTSGGNGIIMRAGIGIVFDD